MAKQVLFIHGGGGGAYAEDAKLASNLREKLGSNYHVHYPKMPHEEEPDYNVWKQVISDELAALEHRAILVGHSIGASVLIKLLTETSLPRSVRAVFLISAPFWYDHDFWRWDEVKLPEDASKLVPNGLHVYLYHGRADESVPFSHMEMYAKALPQAILRPLDGRNHQLNDDLSEVAKDIRELR